MHVKHKSLIFLMVKNYMFEIDIKNTRTRCETCSKIEKVLWTCICLLGSYLHFYCLDDFHYLDKFHCLHDLQKHWNLLYILKLALGWVAYQFYMQWVKMMLAGGGLTVVVFWNYGSCITILFFLNYLIVDGKRSFINKESS